MKKKLFIKGALTQKRALKCKTQQRLKNDNRNFKNGWGNRLSQTCQKNEKDFLNLIGSSSNVWTLLSRLEKEIQKALSNYEQNLTSVLAQFPAQKINNAILDYLSKIDPRERDIVELTLEPIVELCSRYRGGNFRFVHTLELTSVSCQVDFHFFYITSVSCKFWPNFWPNIHLLPKWLVFSI